MTKKKTSKSIPLPILILIYAVLLFAMYLSLLWTLRTLAEYSSPAAIALQRFRLGYPQLVLSLGTGIVGFAFGLLKQVLLLTS